VTTFDPEKVRTELARRDAEIATKEHLANWLQDAADDAWREVYTLQSQRAAFANLTDTQQDTEALEDA
jgi:hypothetical protein